MKCNRIIGLWLFKLLATLACSLSLGLANAAGTTTTCSGTTPNNTTITIAGSVVKKVGDSLDVKYCLANFDPATSFDVYVLLKLPDGTMMYLQSGGGFFGTPTYLTKETPYLNDTLILDQEGSVMTMAVLPAGLPTGTYTFYAIPVLKGGKVMNGFDWVGHLAQMKVTLTK